jgi:erythromycin esterase-like protein
LSFVDFKEGALKKYHDLYRVDLKKYPEVVEAMRAFVPAFDDEQWETLKAKSDTVGHLINKINDTISQYLVDFAIKNTIESVLQAEIKDKATLTIKEQKQLVKILRQRFKEPFNIKYTENMTRNRFVAEVESMLGRYMDTATRRFASQFRNQKFQQSVVNVFGDFNKAISKNQELGHPFVPQAIANSIECRATNSD